jgi:hypothetical protein
MNFIIAIIGIIIFGLKVEDKMLDRRIKRNRAKRGTWPF